MGNYSDSGSVGMAQVYAKVKRFYRSFKPADMSYRELES